LNSFGSIAIVNAAGGVICASDARLNALGHLPVTSALSLVAATGHSVYESAPDFINTHTEALLVAASIPATGGKAGYMVATLPFATILGDAGLGGAGAGSLPRNDVLTVLSADRSTVLLRSAGPATFDGVAVGNSAIGRTLPGGSTPITDLDGVRRIYRDSVITSVGWHVLVGITPGAAFSPAWSNARRALLLGVLLLGVLVGLGMILHRKLARPVHRLRLAIEAASRDNEVRAAIEGPAEVAAVAEAFNATIAERRELERQLSHQALHDPLTKLPNRALLQDRLVQSLGRSRRDNQLTSVMFLDLDRFKVINDAHGHPVGDQLLVSLAGRLNNAVRSFDTVARFGGDEFVILAEVASIQEARELATRTTDALHDPIELDGREIRISGSLGLALSHGLEEPYELIRNADAAMYKAKDENRGGYVVYEDGMHAKALDRLDTERELYRAVHGGELFVEYQPKVSLETGATVGVEALVRWNHPTRGVVAPADFIPVAEETGQILAVGEWVLAESCSQAARWEQEIGHPIEVSVNLSVWQLSRDDLPGIVDSIIRASGIRPDALCLEVTEGCLLGDVAAVTRRLDAIRSLGVKVSVDDFGTGYSSLAYLRQLPLDEIKIDRSFVTDLADSETARAIVANIIGLGRALNFTVVAEGVETRAQLEVLSALGCNSVQGFYLGRPAAAATLPRAMLDACNPLVPVNDRPVLVA
jgi:diguanylate cyclase (GGDEF)-like protein